VLRVLGVMMGVVLRVVLDRVVLVVRGEHVVAVRELGVVGLEVMIAGQVRLVRLAVMMGSRLRGTRCLQVPVMVGGHCSLLGS
jgi:hypothetical protein